MNKRASATLSDLLRESARARNYPFLERAALWEQRLLQHIAELDQLRAAQSQSDMLTLPPKANLEVQAPSPPSALKSKTGELTDASAREIAQRVAAKDASAVEVARAALERAQAQSALNAFITLRPEQVLEEARAIDARIARGEAPGPLAGVPIAVKDLMYVRGHPFTCGTRAMDGKEATRDAAAVARLREAGALILGTANLHELAYGVTSANPHFKPVQNPIAPEHIPGGSSGGSGALAAAGIAPITVGTDTGGSIRIPAACCGVAGFKPTHEAVSREGCWPLADTLDTIGPLARDVADAVLAFEAMAGLPQGYIGGKLVERPRLVRPERFFFEHLDAGVRACLESALGRLARAGATVLTADIAEIENAPAAQFITICTEACQSNWDLLTRRGEGIGPDVRLRLEVGQFIGAIDYVKAQRVRRRIRENTIAALANADVLIVPTLPIAVPKRDEMTIRFGGRIVPLPGVITRFTGPISAAGVPACSIVAGKDISGLPVSMQLVGRPGADATVLAVAKWAQSVLA
jgi:aspartyl-tRNA(Asn)/glutamyl-tRNA(Gln) amidotransferase subunit A